MTKREGLCEADDSIYCYARENKIRKKLRTVPLSSFILSFVGGGLDLISGTLIYQSAMNNAGHRSTMMGTQITIISTPDLTWPLILFSLGMAIIVTGLVGVTSVEMKRMPAFGGLMIVYGLVMVSVGAIMYSGAAPAMTMVSTSAVFGLSMLVVGALMVINGALMVKGVAMKTSASIVKRREQESKSN